MSESQLSGTYDLAIIGGGAAGFFSAIQCAEKKRSMQIIIIEKAKDVLNKVRISGGGRCNVTHGCFDPKEMVEHYPRGKKELLGPFHRFLGDDMIHWLASHGVETKTEKDGRVFPVTDNSETIIRCFLNLCKKYNITIRTSTSIESVSKVNDRWTIELKQGNIQSNSLLIASGSSLNTWKMVQNLGHNVIEPVPSLFTFNIDHPILKNLSGVSLVTTSVNIYGTNIAQEGALLITHWGLSGPAILKLSAWGARKLAEEKYNALIQVNWINIEPADVQKHLEFLRKNQGARKLISIPLFDIPKRLWQRMVEFVNLDTLNIADLQNSQIIKLTEILTSCPLQVKGKSINKDEFVTCGGVDTSEINFKTMESKLIPGLYFAGEVINIDAVTGGFNFQAAWTEAYIAAEAIACS